MTEFASYEEMRQHIGQLNEQGQYAKAAAILEKALAQFPEHLLANSYNLGYFYVLLDRYEEGVRALRYGVDHGVWYSRWNLAHEVWNPLRGRADFAAVEAVSAARLQEAQRDARSELVVETPAGYVPENRYPLFFALHGGGEKRTDLQPHWRSPRLHTGFIVAFLQSAQVASMNGFWWGEPGYAREQVTAAYEQLSRAHRIDPAAVLVSGFSDGGRAAIEIALDPGTLPIRSFIALCPPVPEALTAEAAAAAAARGLRGTLLSTEMDPRLAAQQEMVQLLQSAGVAVRVVVSPNIGHWYPDDLGEQLDAAIEHIGAPTAGGAAEG
jgi:predicted esterase